MKFAVLSRIKHNGEVFEPGATLPALSESEAKRLLDSGAIKEVDEHGGDEEKTPVKPRGRNKNK